MDSPATTRKIIASQYKVDVKTLQRWCDKHGIHLEKRDRLSPKVVQQIYACFGCPIMPDEVAKCL